MPGENLTHLEAIERAEVITKVNDYKVSLLLTGEGETFRSKTQIHFEAKPGSSTFLDVIAANITHATLNGKPIDTAEYEGARLALENLKARNVVEVEGDFYYMNTGEGMHRSVDPADGETYLYTQFEVPDARRVFPTFEQPDLKASFAFDVTVEPKWKVFSVSPTPKPTEMEDGMWRYDFAPTPRISTYVTAVVAGPFEGRSRKIRSVDGREIELGTYCRASLIDHLDSEEIMEVTEAGFKFFETEFAIPYPFIKYDQVFVPEFNFGAMENVGCVTIRDQFLFRSRPTDWDLENRANLILHELSHMWFGNLVTMKWWDDLWLNESFAEYMAHLASAEATRFKDAWVGFIGRKEWGLAQDQKPTTHPVKTKMADLRDVEVNFDGITYAKGAAVLRQMVSYVGRENFFKGLHRYLSKHAWGNATLTDLLAELEEASGRDMLYWTSVWVEEAGVTTLRPEMDVNEDGIITDLNVLQEAPGEETLRPHSLVVAGYSTVTDPDSGREIVEPVFRTELDAEGETTPAVGVLGHEKPELLLVNDGDLAYAKVRMDEGSLQFAAENIDRIADALTRRVLLGSAWDMTRDGQMPTALFLDLALRAAGAETSTAALSDLLRHVDVAVTRYSAPASRGAHLAFVAKRLLTLTREATPASDSQELFTKALARRAVSGQEYDFLAALYDGSKPLPGLEMGLDLRWSILFALVRSGRAGEPQIRVMTEEDPSLTGQEKAARARATINSDEVREEVWEAVMGDMTIANDTRWQMAAGFWSHAATDPLRYTRFVEKYFDAVVTVWQKHTFQISSRLLALMNPSPLSGYLQKTDVAAMGQTWLATHEERPDALKRLISEGRDDALRMHAAQECDSGA